MPKQTKASSQGPAASLKLGQKAPAFKLPAQDGELVSLKSLAGQTVVLFFYPKALTPGCTQEAEEFQAALAQFKRRKAVVIGASRDSVERQAKFAAKHGIKLPLLSDEAGALCEAYGVWQEKSLYGRKFMGIVRTTFVIGADGKIAAIFDKVKVQGHVAAVLAAI